MASTKRWEKVRTASEKASAPRGRPDARSSETYCSMWLSRGLVDFLRELRLVFVFIGCTRLAGSDYPMDTKFLTLSFEELPMYKEAGF